MDREASVASGDGSCEDGSTCDLVTQEDAADIESTVDGAPQVLSRTFDVGSASDFLQMFAHPRRLKILTVLVSEEMSVKTLAARIEASQTVTSQHLSLLRAAGLVVASRKGQQFYYSSTSERARRMIDTIGGLQDGLAMGAKSRYR